MGYVKRLSVAFDGNGLFCAEGPMQLIPSSGQIEFIRLEMSDGSIWEYPAGILTQVFLSWRRGQRPELSWTSEDGGWTISYPGTPHERFMAAVDDVAQEVCRKVNDAAGEEG